MFRFVGFLVGSALAIAAMLLLLGVPQLEIAGPLVEAREPQPPPSETVEPTVEAVAVNEPEGIPVLDPGPAEADVRWQAFWNPFRSELAATGFVSRLERVTGLDYRVVKMKPGAYQVAFAYVEDEERLTRLAQIEAATGLNLPETQP